MPYLTFRIENTNDDQVITVLDLKNQNQEVFRGPINHSDQTADIQCWKGGDDKGRVQVSGSVSAIVLFDVRDDGEVLRY